MLVVSFHGMMAFLLMPDSTNCYLCLRTGVTYLSGLLSFTPKKGQEVKEMDENRPQSQWAKGSPKWNEA
jgi:hypothetical protein